MGKKNPLVDAYVNRSAEFARPILNRIRSIVHRGCPEVEEELKWGFPHFMHKGMLCSMASFKAHCAFGFWKGRLVLGNSGKSAEAMGQFGRLTSVSDLPAQKTLLAFVKKAKELNDAGVKARPAKIPREKKPLVVPADLRAALAKNRKAGATFQNFSPSHKREYVDWITEAKTPETRGKRLGTAIDWMAEGKTRNWKYARK
jgi:uncharacterized protein YdeI (YjbR/CyaY-like superfamily)